LLKRLGELHQLICKKSFLAVTTTAKVRYLISVGRRFGVPKGTDIMDAMAAGAIGGPGISPGQAMAVETLGITTFQIRVTGGATYPGLLGVGEVPFLVA